MESKRIELFGIVQGVGMRFFVNHLANKKGLHGFVKNTNKGTVLIEVTGPKATIKSFIKHIERLSPGSINTINVETIDNIYHDGFDINH